jgi:hypothetical protein
MACAGVGTIHLSDKPLIPCERSWSIVRTVTAQHGHGQGLATQLPQTVRNIACAPNPPQRRHHKRNIEDAIGLEVSARKPPSKFMMVPRQGAANQNRLKFSFQSSENQG